MNDPIAAPAGAPVNVAVSPVGSGAAQTGLPREVGLAPVTVRTSITARLVDLARTCGIPAAVAFWTLCAVCDLLITGRHYGARYVIEIQPLSLYPLMFMCIVMQAANFSSKRTTHPRDVVRPLCWLVLFLMSAGVAIAGMTGELRYSIDRPDWLPALTVRSGMIVAANAAACAAVLVVQCRVWRGRPYALRRAAARVGGG
jgi:hypothetical protein